MTESKRKKLQRKLQESRFRLLKRMPELAYPLKDMFFVVTKDVFRMSTNGSCFYFDDAWLDKLSNSALDYALCHQLMHIKLNHLDRSRLYKGARYHYACNIIVNSYLDDYGFLEDKIQGIGELTRETSFPRVQGRKVSPLKAFKMTPFDPTTMSANQRARFMIDSDIWWDRPEDRGEAGIVVLSPADRIPSDLELPEEVKFRLEYIIKSRKELKMPQQNIELRDKQVNDLEDFTTEYIESAKPRLKETVSELKNLKRRDDEEYSAETLTERAVRPVRNIPKDWRTVLNHFIMDETRDYDFTPPDRRMQELDFFIPDFNETTVARLNVLFMVDISGSVNNADVDMAAAEINAAIEQFGGMLDGMIGFFDTAVRKTMPLLKRNDYLKIVPYSGGGTDFECVFSFVKEHMTKNLPSEIVIMTDGKADFPEYSATMGIPVLWLLTNNRVHIPWGQATYYR